MMYLLTPEAHVQIVEALELSRINAMVNVMAARIPECGDFAAIAQNLDWAVATLKAMQPVEPVAYRFMENRGNGNTEFNYYGLDEVGLAYRDNCLEIVDLYTPTKNAVMTGPQAPSP